jgi:hypothetical protein
MAKKYTADTFEGAVTGTASGNVAKAGDTMFGDLELGNGSNLILSANTYPYGYINFAAVGAPSNPSYQILGQSNPGTSSLALRGVGSSTLEDSFVVKSSTGSVYNYAPKPIRIGADAAANELDDYEEGTWTPQMGGYFGGFTLNSYTTQLGKYIKIGRVVHLFFDVEFTGVSSGVSNLVYLFGLPFIPSSDSVSYGGASIGIRYKKNIDLIISGQYDSLIGMAKLGSGTFMYFNMDNGVNTNSLRVNSLTGSNTDSMALEGCITYRTTS